MIGTYSVKQILIVLTVQLAIVITIGCKDRDSKKSNAKPAIASTIAKEKIGGWPKPDSYADRIPVYDQFAGLEPLFRFDNDTTYVVNFWATWCKPCIKELPYFEEFNATYKDEKVKVILVSLDFPKKIESNLVPFVQKQQLKSKVVVLLDGKYNDWIDKISPAWTGAIPATYIYKGGQNRLVASPFESTKELLEAVKPYL